MIKFKKNSTWYEAEKDIRTFRAWLYGEITTEYACELVAFNNDLLSIEPEEFIKSAEELGYRRKGHVE